MKLILFLVLTSMFVSCSTNRYRMPDYAQACSANDGKDEDIDKRTTNVCMPLDTYVVPAHYHRLYPYQQRKMPTMDDALKNR